MPPIWTKDEKKWADAEAKTESDYPKIEKGSDRFFQLATGVYQRLGGRFNPANKLFVACAWCKGVFTKRGYRKVPIPYKLFKSHGICPDCAEKEKRKALQKRGITLNDSDEAQKKFKQFHEFDPKRKLRVKVPTRTMAKTQVKLGTLAYVGYISNKFDKKIRLYHHDFSSPPLFMWDPKTKMMVIAPKKWKITSRGIEG